MAGTLQHRWRKSSSINDLTAGERAEEFPQRLLNILKPARLSGNVERVLRGQFPLPSARHLLISLKPP